MGHKIRLHLSNMPTKRSKDIAADMTHFSFIGSKVLKKKLEDRYNAAGMSSLADLIRMGLEYLEETGWSAIPHAQPRKFKSPKA